MNPMITLMADRYLDSLRQALNQSREDTNPVRILYLLGTYHEAANEDSNYYYIQKKMPRPKGLCCQIFSKLRNDWIFIHGSGFESVPTRHLSFN
jgi:hypothetical protein